MSNFSNIPRREYGDQSLEENHLPASPFSLFRRWFEDALQSEVDPAAMVLSTVDEVGNPNSRVVLLKQLQADHLIFFSNYNSVKAREMDRHPQAALNFYWPNVSRQVRIRGKIERADRKVSEAYFASRPRKSQIASLLSAQSEVMDSRLALDEAIESYDEAHEGPIDCPLHWGGFVMIPHHFEFWQGRDNRVSDRIAYFAPPAWQFHRLAP